MTTEVLRNMLYAGSLTLGGLGYVVLDEVHYLADRLRGAVWEEVIIQLPESVQVVALSATVSNAEEFGDWLEQVRGGTTVIVRRGQAGAALAAHAGRAHGFTTFSHGTGLSIPSFAALRSVIWPRTGAGTGGPAVVLPPVALVAGPVPGASRYRPQPPRGDRAAGRRGAASRDHVHLQPGWLRRGGPAVPGRRAAADDAGGVGRDREDRRGQDRGTGR